MSENTLEWLDPPTDLLAKSLQRIRWERQRKHARLKLVFWGICLLTTVVGLATASILLKSDADSSGFSAILRLAFSDLALARSLGNDLILSILESVPALEIGICLLLGYGAGASFKGVRRAVHEFNGAAINLANL